MESKHPLSPHISFVRKKFFPKKHCFVEQPDMWVLPQTLQSYLLQAKSWSLPQLHVVIILTYYNYNPITNIIQEIVFIVVVYSSTAKVLLKRNSIPWKITKGTECCSDKDEIFCVDRIIILLEILSSSIWWSGVDIGLLYNRTPH